MERVRVKKEMKHKKVILKPTGELEPLWSSPSQSASSPVSVLPASARSQQANTIKIISPTATPPLETDTMVSPKSVLPNLSLGSLSNSNAVSNISLNLGSFQDYSDTMILSPKCIPPSLSLKRNGSLPFGNAVSNNSSFSLNVRAFQECFALECLRAVSTSASFNQAGNGLPTIP
jgi:hypothetical protein